ncbi:kinase-like protein [Apiospora aurea]|uniref:Kinase-like protein n=1 Tax=Apiospora aurea TaxID=335848 RepID=A0ABR1Q1C9_9PEZI
MTYQHPQYLEEDKRYFIQYDYYSLGMVLLEIGIWSPLQDVVRKYLTADPKKIREKVLQDRVPLLGHRWEVYINLLLRPA